MAQSLLSVTAEPITCVRHLVVIIVAARGASFLNHATSFLRCIGSICAVANSVYSLGRLGHHALSL